MSSFVYDKAREAFLGGSINWSSDTIKLQLVTSSYTPSSSSDQFITAYGANTVGSASSAFASKTATSGVADAADVTLTSVSGSAANAIVVFKDTGVAGTSPLIAYIDSTAATGLPVTPNGGNITIAFDNGSNRIFKL